MTNYFLLENIFAKVIELFTAASRAMTPDYRMSPSPPLLAPIAEHLVHEPGLFFPSAEFEDLKQVFGDIQIKLGLKHLLYYDHYKSLFVLLGDLVCQAEKRNVKVLKQQLLSSPNVDVRTFVDDHCLPTTDCSNDELFLSMLVTAYLYHLILEDVYFQKLAVNYDPVAERLFNNGFTLYVLLRKNISSLILEQLLTTFGYPICLQYHNQFKELKQEHPFRGLRQLDEWMLKYNLWRLTLARIRRFYLSVQLFLNLPNLNWMIAFFEPQLRVFILWLNFLYFLPRVLMDIAHLIYHMAFFPGSEFDLKQRAQIFFQRRWESFVRDSLWLINGALSLFVFTGPLGFWGLYLSALVQLIEVLLNLVILLQSNRQQSDIRQGLLSMLKVPAPKQELWKQKLAQRDDVEHQIRYIRLRNSVGVLICNILILPFFLNLHLGIALFGAGLSLMMSVIQFLSVREFANLRKKLPDPFCVSEVEELPSQTSRYLLCSA